MPTADPGRAVTKFVSPAGCPAVARHLDSGGYCHDRLPIRYPTGLTTYRP